MPVKVTLEAGKMYYPWCNMDMTSLTSRRVGTPGMQIAQERASFLATPFISTKPVP
jgi:hypothetical protein